MKEIGVNAIRTSHNPQAPDIYELCDELGLLVMDEAYDEWEFPKRKWIEGWNKGWTPGWYENRMHMFSFTKSADNFDLEKVVEYGKKKNSKTQLEQTDTTTTTTTDDTTTTQTDTTTTQSTN